MEPKLTLPGSSSIGPCPDAGMAPMTQSSRPRNVASCDQEAWVKDRIRDAIRMVEAVAKEKGVRANDGAAVRAIDGIIEGAAEEIIRTLGMEPSYINIKKR